MPLPQRRRHAADRGGHLRRAGPPRRREQRADRGRGAGPHRLRWRRRLRRDRAVGRVILW